nr:dihydrofolate reductase family protein [Egibacter rhizosphaerae]
MSPSAPGHEPHGALRGQVQQLAQRPRRRVLGNRRDERVASQLAAADALLYGRRRYEIFAGYWPHVSDDAHDAALARTLHATPKFVASTTHSAPLSWHSTKVLDGELGAEVAGLKARYQRVHVTGSAALLQRLLRARLVDLLELWTFPVLLGGGKRLFADGTLPASFDLAEVMRAGSGVVITTYRLTP